MSDFLDASSGVYKIPIDMYGQPVSLKGDIDDMSVKYGKWDDSYIGIKDEINFEEIHKLQEENAMLRNILNQLII